MLDTPFHKIARLIDDEHTSDGSNDLILGAMNKLHDARMNFAVAEADFVVAVRKLVDAENRLYVLQKAAADD